MTRIVGHGNAIEGAKATGSSRDPLKNRGMQGMCGVRCHVFVASFDVEAEIHGALEPDGKRLKPEAVTELDCKVFCEKAIIHSLDNRPSTNVSARTGRHQAIFWRFAKQTSITVDKAHQEIANALQNREQQALRPAR